MKKTAIIVPAAVMIMVLASACSNKDDSSVSSCDESVSSVHIEVSSYTVESSSLADSSQLQESSDTEEILSSDESSDTESSAEEIPVSNEVDDSSLPMKMRKGILTGPEDIGLHDIDGGNTNFVFTYDDTEYTAIYTYDNWKIIDSYLIKNMADMEVICQALIDINPIHGKDYESFRTAKDMAYEWDQHNIAYDLLPDDNEWRANVKDVDLNPDDQGKSFLDMYCDRTGKETIFD